MSEQGVEDALVAELARSAVAETAPEELPLFRATSEAYFEDPDSVGRSAADDEMLGFGVETVLVLVTPVALSVARDVLRFVGEQVRRHAREAGTDVIDRLADRLLGRHAEGPPAEAALTEDQLRQVRALALEKAELLKLPREKALLLADSLVGSLATA